MIGPRSLDGPPFTCRKGCARSDFATRYHRGQHERFEHGVGLSREPKAPVMTPRIAPNAVPVPPTVQLPWLRFPRDNATLASIAQRVLELARDGMAPEEATFWESLIAHVRALPAVRDADRAREEQLSRQVIRTRTFT